MHPHGRAEPAPRALGEVLLKLVKLDQRDAGRNVVLAADDRGVGAWHERGRNGGFPVIGRGVGTSCVAPLTVGGQGNPAWAANNIHLIKDTHGKTSHLPASDLDALIAYRKSLDRVKTPLTIQAIICSAARTGVLRSRRPRGRRDRLAGAQRAAP